MAKHLCIGPPGTGKTRFGIDLVKQAIASGIPSDRILYASFTRAASYEARRRAIEAFPELAESDFPYFRTLHSIAFRLLGLSRHAMFDGRRLKDFAQTFSYRFGDSLGRDFLEQDLIDMTITTDADAYLAFDEWRKNKLLLDFDEAYEDFRRKQIELPGDFSKRWLKLFLERKDEYKQKEGLWEFSDMLLKVYQDEIPLDVEFVVYDECQDNSPLLHAVAEIWARGAHEVYLLGDPDQCIYSFMSADPSLMLDWKRDEDIVLRQSYRCSRAVHDLSRKVVEKMKVRYHSDFAPTPNEGVVNRLPSVDLDYKGTTFALFRTRYLMESFYERLLLKGVPFTTRRGKESPLDKGAREAVLALSSIFDGQPVTLTELNRMAKFVPQEPYLKRGAKTELLEKARAEPDRKVSRGSLPQLGFTAAFSNLARGDYLECLKIEAEEKAYFRKLLTNYGREALLETPRLQLGTIHSCKGLEADRVLLSTEMTRLPYGNLTAGDSDSEHRVFYVGVTRARDEVDLLAHEGRQAYPL